MVALSTPAEIWCRGAPGIAGFSRGNLCKGVAKKHGTYYLGKVSLGQGSGDRTESVMQRQTNARNSRVNS